MIDLLLSKTLELLINLGYPGLFIASLGFPVPTEIVIAVLATSSKYNIWSISLVSALGGAIGSYLTYLLGYLFTIRNPDTWLGARIRMFKIDIKEVEKKRKKILKNGFIYIFLTRFVPWLKVVASVAAGFFRQNLFIYTSSVFLGVFVYSLGVAYLGLKVGKDVDTLLEYLNTFDKLLIGILIGYLVVTSGFKNRKKIASWIIEIEKKIRKK